MRALLLALLAIAGCGDDTIATSPDLAIPCNGSDLKDCCHRGVISFSMPPQTCDVVGDSCLEFERVCTCTSAGVWACRSIVPTADLSTRPSD